jgi:hypothetical protein
MLWLIYDHTRRDRVWKDDICERLGVTPVKEKLIQYHLRWFEHMQQRSAEASIHNRVIRRVSNKKRCRGRPNFTWEKSVKRDLKDWCITKELALDRRECKLAIYVSEPWCLIPSFYCILSSFFPVPFFAFWLSVLFFSPFWFDFLSPFIFSLLFYSFFVPIFSHVVSSLAYPNLRGNKRFDCCCCYLNSYIDSNSNKTLSNFKLLHFLGDYRVLTVKMIKRYIRNMIIKQ